MSKKDSVRIKAEEWYIDHPDCTLAEIADLFKVTPKTAGNWAKEFKWEEKRVQYQASPVRTKQILQDEFIWIAQGNKPRIDTDALSKVNASLERVDKKADPYVVAQILKDLDNHISHIDPKFAASCTQFHKSFLQHRINLEA